MKLQTNEIESALRTVSGWVYDSNAIQQTWTFANFAQALLFVNHVGFLAEGADHHPDIDIRYAKVTLQLSTHSAGGVTEKDFAFARKLSGGALLKKD